MKLSLELTHRRVVSFLSSLLRLLGRDLPPSDQGSSQRKHPHRPRGSLHPHRLRFHALEQSREHGFRGCSVQAHDGSFLRFSSFELQLICLRSLLQEYVDIMGGVASPGFQLFKKLFKEGFEAARKHSDEIISESLSAAPSLRPSSLTSYPPLLAIQPLSNSCNTVRLPSFRSRSFLALSRPDFLFLAQIPSYPASSPSEIRPPSTFERGSSSGSPTRQSTIISNGSSSARSDRIGRGCTIR